MTNILIPKGYEFVSEASLVVLSSKLQKELLCQIKKVNYDFYQKSILAALAKTSVDQKGVRCCLIDISEVKPGETGKTITEQNFVVEDSMELKLNTMVQPMFLDNHMTLNVVVIEILT